MRIHLTEKKFVWMVIACVVFVTVAPYVYGFLNKPDGATYSGIHHLTPGDTNTYLSMIEQGKEGSLVFRNLYTPEEGSAIFFNAVWCAGGLFARAFHTSSLFAYHALRVVLIPFFFFALWALLRYLFADNERLRKIIMLVIVGSAGLGVFFNPFLFDPNNLLEHPTDIWVPESITFLSLYHSPHLIASVTLLIVSLYFGMRVVRERRIRFALYSGISAAFLFSIHPFYVATLYIVLVLWWFFQCLSSRKVEWHSFGLLWLIVAISAPVLYYFIWLQQKSIVYASWSAQNILDSPSPWMYLIGYGLLIPFAAWGVMRIRKYTSLIYMLVWLCATIVLLYAPIPFQRRLVEGLHIPLSIFAGIGIIALYDRLRQRMWYVSFGFVVFVCIFLPLTNIQTTLQDVYYYTERTGYPYYIPSDARESMEWLRERKTNDDIVLTHFFTGNYIPAYALMKTFVGHSPQTIDFKTKVNDSYVFFDATTTDEWRIDFLRSWGITYVYYGIHEKESGDFDPSNASYLTPVFARGETTVYSVSL